MNQETTPRSSATAVAEKPAAPTGGHSDLLAGQKTFPFWGYLSIGLAIFVLTAWIEHATGRVTFSTSGKILWWVRDVNGPENSQQLTDWYSFSHLLHGVLFYGALHLISRLSGGRILNGLGGRVILMILLEAGWEILENSPIIINRYREATLALGYCGDSILNSMSDIVCCILGFFVAKLLPVWATVLLFVGLELFVLWAIRDNLTLNILMLIHPVEAIKHWQSLGAGATM